MNLDRQVRLMLEAVHRCRLDLAGLTVFTEAASGAYAVTPVIAALAGARVVAQTKSTAYGTSDEVRTETMALAERAGVVGAIDIVTERRRELVERADIVTNSGHVRPIDAVLLTWTSPTVVIPLMYEAWEFRDSDVDLAACRMRSIPVAGTNERHPDIDVFSFLGVMALQLLIGAGIASYRSRVLLLCDNDFDLFIARTLSDIGNTVDVVRTLEEGGQDHYDAILVALTPRREPVIRAAEASIIAERWPGAVLAQYWGDVDRAGIAAAGVPVWPLDPPKPGHMAILPSAIGPEPIVRLQAGGLKVGEVLSRARHDGATADEALRAAHASGYATLLGAGRA